MTTFLGAEVLPVTRRVGSYVDGEWVPVVQSTFNATCSVQPLSGRDIQLLPEGQRTTARYKAYSDTELRTASVALPAMPDRLVWHGSTYEVHTLADWTAHSDGLPHYKYALVEVGADE